MCAVFILLVVFSKFCVATVVSKQLQDCSRSLPVKVQVNDKLVMMLVRLLKSD